jgi:hypothetical protein
MVPSKIDSPIWGMSTSVGIGPFHYCESNSWSQPEIINQQREVGASGAKTHRESYLLRKLRRWFRYIDTQEAHHCRRTFEQEFVALLEKHGVRYDQEFVRLVSRLRRLAVFQPYPPLTQVG